MRSEEIAQLLDVIWAMFLGLVQLEESKFRTTRKDHLPATLEYGFSLIARGLLSDRGADALSLGAGFLKRERGDRKSS